MLKLKEIIQEKILGYRILKSLTGKPKDLRKILDVNKLSSVNLDYPIKNFLKSMEDSLNQGTNFAKIFLRVGSETSKSYKKKLIQNLIINQFVKGRAKRRSQYEGDNIIPNFFVVSPTMRCNLHCRGCYSGLYRKDGELSEEDLDKLFHEAREMGIHFIVISGGEPYLIKDTLLRLFKKYDDMFFLTYTNGTFLDKKTANTLGKLGNVAPAISVEGWEAETDARRGKGTWNKIMNAMENLRNAGVLFGISVTATRHNQAVITEDSFVEFFMEKGAIFGWYFMFMPVGKDPDLDLVPTPEQRHRLGKRVEMLRERYPMFLADFWNDGPAVGGCLAGGRQYLHILNSGKVEPCVFVHFGQDNIKEKSLKEIVNSPFFKHIRKSFPYNENANLKRPCIIIDNPEVLREAVNEHLVPAGHTHSEDIINDPKVRDWIDRYVERFKELTEPEWERIINDPKERWYKNGPEYKGLFEWYEPRAQRMDLKGAIREREKRKREPQIHGGGEKAD